MDFTSQYSTRSPSFSSTLLDAIYRSIDRGEDDAVCYRKEWRELEDVVLRRRSIAEFPVKVRENSSSCGGGGGESFSFQRPKPVRLGVPATGREKLEPEHTEKREGGLLKTKSRALRLYSDLKKVKQPISPGGKIAGLLNALFAGGNQKKAKTSDAHSSPSLKSATASTSSSASSFSRSCLSKTPSSRGKSSTATGAKRSVSFSPVSVIVGDDHSLPPRVDISSFDEGIHNRCGTNTQHSISDLTIHVTERNRRVEEIARDLLKNYHRKNSPDHLRNPNIKIDDLEEEDDDAASYASSDLFELDNLSGIGMEELPVYETTHLHTNQAIAKGLLP